MLSVIVPVYNEAQTVDELLQRLRDGPYPDKQTIVVDDGSRDGTAGLLEKWEKESGHIVLRHEYNRGKGAAIRTALPHVTEKFVIFQDADLEYDPAEIPRLIQRLDSGDCSVVFGSRYLNPTASIPRTRFRLAGTLFNGVVRILYRRRLTDVLTCYKAFRSDLLKNLDLRSERFEVCMELTAKVCRRHIPIVEVPISYAPRRRQDGKKISWRDAWPLFWTLVKWRIFTVQGGVDE